MNKIYLSYCTKEDRMDSSKFLKFCKDSQVISERFRSEDVDVIFAKFKEAGQRYMTYTGFNYALEEIANKKRMSTAALVELIVDTKIQKFSPSNSGTIAQANRFHDDQRLYTGVHKAGGPTNIDKHNLVLSDMVDRNTRSNNSQPAMHIVGMERSSSPSPNRNSSSPVPQQQQQRRLPTNTLNSPTHSQANYESYDNENTSSTYSPTPLQKRMNISNMVEKKASKYPTGVTVPAYNRFHDDPRTYTGVHKAGGPTFIDKDKATLHQLVDRDVKSNQDWSDPVAAMLKQRTTTADMRASSPVRSSSPSPRGNSNTAGSLPTRNSPQSDYPIERNKPSFLQSVQSFDTQQLQHNSARSNQNNDNYNDSNDNIDTTAVLNHLFDEYASKSINGIDSSKFLKFCKDSDLIGVSISF